MKKAGIICASDKELLEIASAMCSKNKIVHFGLMATGEKFIKDDMRDEINKKYSPLSVDMETAGIAHVCYVNNVPFIVIRSITDTADHSSMENFEENCVQASIISKNIVISFLAELKKLA